MTLGDLYIDGTYLEDVAGYSPHFVAYFGGCLDNGAAGRDDTSACECPCTVGTRLRVALLDSHVAYLQAEMVS
jgi:hypothetical protein